MKYRGIFIKVVVALFLTVFLAFPTYGKVLGSNEFNIDNPYPSVVDIAANGLWLGNVIENGVVYDLRGLIYNGRIMGVSLSAGTIYDGTYTLIGDMLFGNVTIYAINGGPVGTSRITGVVIENVAINATYTTSYGTVGSINLIFDVTYNLPSSLSLITGVWKDTNPSFDSAVFVSNDGSFVVQSTTECPQFGDISILDPAHDVYNISETVMACGLASGFYTGLGFVADPNTVVVLLTNLAHTQSTFSILVRQ